MTSREMFEKFYYPVMCGTNTTLERDSSGQYYNRDLELAWQAWRMSASYRHEGELE